MKKLSTLITGIILLATLAYGAPSTNYVSPPDDTAYNATTWDGNKRAPTKNAVRDRLEAIAPGGVVATAAALAANGANCSAGNYPLGVDASGAVESCTAAPTAASLHVDDILTALGIASEATHFGTFTGSTINDNVTVKAALQALETAVELKANSAALKTDNTDGSSGGATLPIIASDNHIEEAILVGLEISGTTSPTLSVTGCVSSNADPGTAAGNFKHDSTDTGSNSGGTWKWYDGAQVRSVVDTGTNYTIITKTDYLPIRYAENGSSAPDAAAAVTGKVLIARNFAEGEDVVFFWSVPNDYIGGGSVKYRVHYALSTDGEADDTVTFSMTGCVIANSADIACSAGTALTISDELGTSDDQYEYLATDYSAESNADWGVVAGGMEKLAFSYAAAGDYTHDVLVVGIEIKYKAKVMGFSDY